MRSAFSNSLVNEPSVDSFISKISLSLFDNSRCGKQKLSIVFQNKNNKILFQNQ